MASLLDAIAANEVNSTSGQQRLPQCDRDYLDAFYKSGTMLASDPPRVIASKIRASNISDRLISALYDWSFVAHFANPARRGWVWDIIGWADHDASGQREHIRDSAVWNDPEKLTKSASELSVAQQPVAFCLALSHQVGGA